MLVSTPQKRRSMRTLTKCFRSCKGNFGVFTLFSRSTKMLNLKYCSVLVNTLVAFLEFIFYNHTLFFDFWLSSIKIASQGFLFTFPFFHYILPARSMVMGRKRF